MRAILALYRGTGERKQPGLHCRETLIREKDFRPCPHGRSNVTLRHPGAHLACHRCAPGRGAPKGERLIKSIVSATAVAGVVAVAGCAGTQPAQSSHARVSSPLAQDSGSSTSVKLLWSYTDKNGGDTEVWYVVHVVNPASTTASVALNVRALDSSDTIVGSDQPTLPNIAPRTSFDYFGNLGGGFKTLSGTPASITVSRAQNAFGRAGAVELPTLKTGELKFQPSDPNAVASTADTPNAYDFSAKVTNTTGQEMTSGVTQQIVLYDASGYVVGGETGSSDNVPDSLPAGMSYREFGTSVPALHPAVRAVYTVWPAS